MNSNEVVNVADKKEWLSANDKVTAKGRNFISVMREHVSMIQ